MSENNAVAGTEKDPLEVLCVIERLEVGAYYSNYQDNAERDPESPDFMYWQKDMALSLRFDLNLHWVFKVEAHQVDGIGLLTQTASFSGDLDKDWSYYAAKASFVF